MKRGNQSFNTCSQGINIHMKILKTVRQHWVSVTFLDERKWGRGISFQKWDGRCAGSCGRVNTPGRRILAGHSDRDTGYHAPWALLFTYHTWLKVGSSGGGEDTSILPEAGFSVWISGRKGIVKGSFWVLVLNKQLKISILKRQRKGSRAVAPFHLNNGQRLLMVCSVPHTKEFCIY